MLDFIDNRNRRIRLTDERLSHIETDHPEMRNQVARIQETLAEPDRIVASRSDERAELYYRFYLLTPVTSKFLCVVVKDSEDDGFVVTAYYTNTQKKGTLLWQKK